MVLEFVLVLWTLARSLAFWRRGVYSTLVRVITEDNLLYFVGVFVFMATNVGICTQPSLYPYYGIIVELTLCMNSVIASRLFLNLRATAYPEKLEHETEMEMEGEDARQTDELSVTEASISFSISST